MSAAVGPSRLLRTHLDRVGRALRGVERGEVQAVHRARVASRRLRELIPLLQIDRAVTRKFVRRMRRVTSRLGTVRELDVLLALIEDLHPGLRLQTPADVLGSVATSVARERDRAREHLLNRVRVAEMRRVARKLRSASREADRRPWAVEARIARRATVLGDAMRAAGAVYLAERLHAVRIAAKRLRYTLELANELAGSRKGSDVRTLRRAQDALGRLHDLQVLIDRVRQAQATLAPPSVTVWRTLDNLVSRLDNECRRLHARYMRLRPELDALVDRLAPSPRRARSSSANAR
jgi:CHAD domain-containing protein